MPAACRTRRSLALGSKGTVFVGSRLQDKVYAITNKNGKHEAKVLVSGLYRPNGVAFKDGLPLYIAELSQISKIDNVEDKLDSSPKPVVIYNDLPKDEAHGWKFIAIGPDNKLYLEVGQPGNNLLHDKDHGQLRSSQSRRQRCRSDRVWRPSLSGVRLESDDQGALLLRQRPRLAV